MDRQGDIYDECVANEETESPPNFDGLEPDTKHEADAYSVFKRYVHDACMNIELAAQCDTLECPEWQRLGRQLSHIAGIAGLYDQAELGLLARELEKGLEILTPRARVRRLMNARDEFARLAVADADSQPGVRQV